MKIPVTGAHYRPEIDGLRALAVISVVLYHARVPFVSGGFAGVDVFFAISGYVVIGTLQREQHQAGRIDWLRFVIRRARRLLPMLWLTVLLSLMAGYSLLPPFGEFQQLCKSAIAALGLSANLYFWREAGSYFSTGLYQWPLMHLWSLAVEEQFYLLVPAIFLLARWRRLGGLAMLTVLLTLASFALAAWGTWTHPIATFYLPVTRAWEFGLGALAAQLQVKPLPHRGFGAALLVSIIASFFLIEPDSPLQPLIAGLPAVFTALLLAGLSSKRQRSVGSALLQQPWLVWVGQRAYAWYLLHWPVLVFYRLYWQEDVSPLELAAVSAGSLLLAALAYRYLELPARYRDWRSIRAPFRVLALAGLGSASLATLLFLLGSQAPTRQAEPRWQSVAATKEWIAEAERCMQGIRPDDQLAAGCRFGQKSEALALFLWGDSHAYHLRHSLAALSAQLHLPMRTFSKGGCPPLRRWPIELDIRSFDNEPCRDFEARASEEMTGSSRKIVVLAARWQPYLRIQPISWIDRPLFAKLLNKNEVPDAVERFTQALVSTTEQLEQAHSQIILIAPIPEQRAMIPTCLQRFGDVERCSTSRSEVEQYRATTMQMLHALQRQHPGSVQLIDPIDLFCNARRCEPGPAGEPWYADDDHLSDAGARKMEPMLKAAIAEARKRLAATESSN